MYLFHSSDEFRRLPSGKNPREILRLVFMNGLKIQITPGDAKFPPAVICMCASFLESTMKSKAVN